jgi:hypothetical protein
MSGHEKRPGVFTLSALLGWVNYLVNIFLGCHLAMKTEKPLDSLYSFQMAYCVIFRVIVRFCFAEKPVFLRLSGVVHILTALLERS